MKKIAPIGKWILIRPKEDQTERKTAGGIVLPETAPQTKVRIGTVLRVGDEIERWDDADIINMDPEEADEPLEILYDKYAGTEVEDPATKEKLWLIQEQDVIAELYEDMDED